jgi:hypothetical protein
MVPCGRDPLFSRFVASQRRQARRRVLCVQRRQHSSSGRGRFRLVPTRVSAPPRPPLEFKPTRQRERPTLESAIAVTAYEAGLPPDIVAHAVQSALHWRPTPAPAVRPPGVHPLPSSPLSVPFAERLSAASGIPHLPHVAAYGATVAYHGPRTRHWRANHAAAYARMPVIDEHMRAERAAGRIFRTTYLYWACPHLAFITNPMAPVPKKSLDPSAELRFRIIMDASSDAGLSVNSFVLPGNLQPIALSTPERVGAVLAAMRAARPGVAIIMQSFDLDNAYRRIPVRAEDWWLQGILWRDEVYWDTHCRFGIRSAGYEFGAYSTAIERYLAAGAVTALGYVDDFITPAYADEYAAAEAAFRDCCASAGLPISTSKLDAQGPPSIVKEHAGWVYDSDKLTIAVPPARLHRLRRDVGNVLASRHSSIIKVQRLHGRLLHAAQGMVSMRAFLSSLRHAISGRATRPPSHRVHVSAPIRADLSIWRDVLRDYSGVSAVPAQPPPGLPRAELFTDASTSWGWGLMITPSDGFPGVWAHGPWAPGDDGTINPKEAATVALGVALAARLGLRHISVRSDSQVTIDTLTFWRASSRTLTAPMRAYAYFTSTTGAFAFPSHVQGINNPADELSRGSSAGARAQYPGAAELTVPAGWYQRLMQSAAPWASLASDLTTPALSPAGTISAPAAALTLC